MNVPGLCRLRLLPALLLLIATAIFCVRSDAQTSVVAPHVKVSLLADQASISADAAHTAMPPHLGLLFDLEPGWHVYWTNAGDSGEPPDVKWTLPAGATVGPLQFPAPKRLPLGPLMDFGYEGQVLFPAELHIHTGNTAGATAGIPIAADVRWLVCRQACVPGKAHLTLDLPMGTGGPSAATPLFQKTFASMPKVLPARAKAIFSRVPGGFELAVLTGTRVDGAQFFPADQNVIANAAPQPVTPRGDGAVIALKQDENLQTAPLALGGIVLLPDGTSYLIRAAQGVIPPPPISVPESAGLLRYVGFALIGGVLLNLMPCVFPVLFIKALALVQSSTVERRAMRVQGLVYTLGILVSFWIVVAVLLALRAGGQQLGWGFQFQSPVFVAMIALLLFFLGLSLAGMFEIGLSVTSAGSSLANKHGLAGSFFTGVLAVVVATPCAAPFLGAAIGFALVQSSVVAFAVFTALGVGLALPYLLLAFQPAWTKLLPKPGAWMELLKQATAVPIFATVIWLVWVFAQLAGATALIGLLSAFLLLGIAGWVLGRWPAKLPATATAVVILVLAIAAPVYAVRTFQPAESVASGAAGAHTDHTRAWQPFTPDVVAQYQAQGRPVFVDFTADWCLSCQVNERVVLERPDVLSKLQDGKIALVRADWTRHDEDIARALASLGRSSVPTYALYPGTPGAPARVLPEVLTTNTVLDALKTLPNPDAGGARTASLTPSR
ncbi:MAG TPA: thioredoxin family protein [Acidobacteriaceae bacterium]|jgi:DsbC/DsbD-like thiol-disulfide interchange protein/cytochrome c biogenesis protein CcdA|nr:thioredoxin family protein [Acidobacteriaceae bacterium]